MQKTKLLRAKDFLLETIFPKECVGCGQDETWLCEPCLQRIVYVQSPTCPSCHRLTPEGQYCSRHKKGQKLKGAYVAAYYKEGPLKEAIHVFKYELIKELAIPLGRILSQALNEKDLRKTVLVPIALHPRRERQRGFNQAGLLAKEISIITDLPIENGLKRIRYTKRQVDLDDKGRLTNTKNAFAWDKSNKLTGKKVLLVDDVLTTGATLNAAAEVLKKESRAKEVWGLVIARG